MVKQATTIATQAALAAFDLAVEICTRPWIVELSKKSRRVEETIFILNFGQVTLFKDMFGYKLLFKVDAMNFLNTTAPAPCQCRGATKVLVVTIA